MNTQYDEEIRVNHNTVVIPVHRTQHEDTRSAVTVWSGRNAKHFPNNDDYNAADQPAKTGEYVLAHSHPQT